MPTQFTALTKSTGEPVRLDLRGNWNASTNSPALVSSTGILGEAYRVSTAGSTTLNGISTWAVEDYVYFDGSVWRKDDHNNATGFTPGNITEVTATTYAILTTDDTVLVNQASAAAVTLTLPTGASHGSKRVQVKDKRGSATTYNITINTSGGETIDAGASLVLNQNYAAVDLVFNGTEWSIL